MNNPEHAHVHETEVSLLARAEAGEHAAQRALFDQYRAQAYAVAQRITGRREDALDVVQDAFIKVFAQLRQHRRGSNFRSWLLRIVSNQAIDLVRSRRVRRTISLHQHRDEEGGAAPVVAAAQAPADGDLEQRELQQRLEEAIQSLPLEQRSVFSLYALGELSYGEIAEALGIPMGTVMSRLHHARKKLHVLLADLAPAGRAADARRGQTEQDD